MAQWLPRKLNRDSAYDPEFYSEVYAQRHWKQGLKHVLAQTCSHSILHRRPEVGTAVSFRGWMAEQLWSVRTYGGVSRRLGQK